MFPLDGRRLWLVGIGGAGLSAYAILTRAWGADVAGWDRVETPYLARVRAEGIPVTIGPKPVAGPAGFETVVSTAFAGQVPGTTRAELPMSISARAEPAMLLGLALYSMRHRNLFAAEGLDEIRDAIHHLDTPLARPLRHPFRRRRPLPDRSS